jgi:transposase
LICIDEAGVNIAMARPYARSLEGTRDQATKPCNKGKTRTMLGALSLQGLTASMTIEGSIDTDIFLTYVQEILCPCLRPGQVVILDNLKPHKIDEVREAIASVGARIECLPPYSPDFSPIEACWSKVKALIRAKAARTYGALDRAMMQAFNAITSDDVQGWFSPGGYVAQ